MSGQHGTKELSEALVAAITLFKEVQKVLKDGAQVADLIALINKWQNDPQFKAVIEAGFIDAENIKVEIADFGLMDAVELLQAVLPAINKA